MNVLLSGYTYLYLARRYGIDCIACGLSMGLDARDLWGAQAEAFNLGWRYVEDFGNVCPRCLEQDRLNGENKFKGWTRE